jgi:menaquinone-specific isochorismate synthase
LDLPASTSPSSLFDRTDLPEEADWCKIIENALKAIHQGNLGKVVLARKTTLRFTSPIDPWDLFLRLRKSANPSATLFCVQQGPHSAFLGATPEKLFTRDGRNLSTMAVAGTRKRSLDPVEDEALSQELLNSIKDRREVDFVADFILEAIDPLCERVELAPLTVLKSARVQHLHYPIHAILKEGISDAVLMQILHPTPALGGTPRSNALAFIEQHEPFSRGYYGAPIGWSSDVYADVAVAIRSAMIENCDLHLFAGTGIVEGSKPLDEWEELEHKISPFLAVL